MNLESLPDSGLSSHMPLVPAGSIAGRALSIVVAIMTFLACLTAGGAMLMGEASQNWRADVSRDVTIQIKPDGVGDIEALVAKAAQVAQSSPGVVQARAYSRAESEKLLEPWLGNGLDLGQLPVPRMIVVKMKARDAADIEALRSALAVEAPQAVLDDHRLWLTRLDIMANAIVAFAVALFVLMISAMAMAVGFATRGAMAGNRETIEVLHFVGAADSYIARQFQSHFQRLGFRGAFFGGFGAALFFAIAAVLSAWWRNSLGGDEIAALFGAFALGASGYFVILILCAGIGLLTGMTSRVIVTQQLRRLL